MNRNDNRNDNPKRNIPVQYTQGVHSAASDAIAVSTVSTSIETHAKILINSLNAAIMPAYRKNVTVHLYSSKDKNVINNLRDEIEKQSKRSLRIIILRGAEPIYTLAYIPNWTQCV
jgi:hypothetical protein